MDGRALLREVSEAYRHLQTLALELTLIDESGDENASQRTERRTRFWYASPGRMRSESRGRGGILIVADGTHLHTCFTQHLHPDAKPSYTSVTIDECPSLPHSFNPDWPVQVDAHLFPRIDERVVSAEILRQEDGCSVVAVEYEPRPAHEGLMVHASPVLFWIDDRNRMVMRREGKSGHRFPTNDDIRWSRHTMVVRDMQVNEPIADEIFRFTPPEGAVPETGRGFGGGHGFGGGGFVHNHPDEKRRFETRRSLQWEDEALLDRTHWKIGGLKLQFERRLRFSEDGRELQVEDRLSGPQGEVQTSCKLPIA
jgi:hypothetical protein